MKAKFTVLLAILFLVLATSSCSGGKNDLTDNRALYEVTNYMNGWQMDVTNINIYNKGWCGELSNTATADGVDGAWIIGYTYDFSDNGNFSDGTVVITKSGDSFELHPRQNSCP